jgi:hypothetical protein
MNTIYIGFQTLCEPDVKTVYPVTQSPLYIRVLAVFIVDTNIEMI